MKTFIMFAAILVSISVAADAIAQRPSTPATEPGAPRPNKPSPAQGPEAEKTVEGQVGNIDPTRTEITLTDGTRLMTPPGAVVKPGVLTEGMTVVASYREENGRKVLTGLAVKEKAPSNPPRQN
jgi:Protein of unknown function (DUF1344)